MPTDYTSDKFDVFEKNDANYIPLSPAAFLPRAALMFGDRTALIYGDRRYNWAQVYDRSRAMASALNRRGIGRGDTVAVLAANTPELVELHYAVPMAGAVLNTINIRLAPDTIAYILNHGEAKILFTDAAFGTEIKTALLLAGRDDLEVIDIVDPSQSDCNHRLGALTYDEMLAGGDPNYDWSGPQDEWDAVALNYTSGTSGSPKGVVYHHRGSYLMTMGTIADWALPRHLTYLYTVPMFHCNGWGHAWSVAALAGTIVCTRMVTPDGIYQAICDHGVTHFGGAPIVLAMIVNAGDAVRRDLPHRVEIMTAGAPPPATILQGIEALGFNVTQVYGLTETYGHTVMCTWNSDWDAMSIAERATMKARQGAGMSHGGGLRVVNLDNGRDVAADGSELGEVLLRGNTIMKGYLKSPEATSAAFDAGWFRSGDLAVMHPRGYIEIKDRLKDFIISGGENISSVEVEAALHRHPSVALAAVVAMPDEKWGEVPCAFVELKDGETTTAEEIIAFARSVLAGFKRPKQVIFGTLPKTATGKIQKFVLRDRVRQGRG